MRRLIPPARSAPNPSAELGIAALKAKRDELARAVGAPRHVEQVPPLYEGHALARQVLLELRRRHLLTGKLAREPSAALATLLRDEYERGRLDGLTSV